MLLVVTPFFYFAARGKGEGMGREGRCVLDFQRGRREREEEGGDLVPWFLWIGMGMW